MFLCAVRVDLSVFHVSILNYRVPPAFAICASHTRMLDTSVPFLTAMSLLSCSDDLAAVLTNAIVGHGLLTGAALTPLSPALSLQRFFVALLCRSVTVASLILCGESHITDLDSRSLLRPFKRKKETCLTESKNMVPKCSKDEWGLFEDIDIYESMDCDDSIHVSGDKDGSSKILTLGNLIASSKATSAKQMSRSRSDQVCFQIKQLTVSSSAEVIKNVRPKMVMQENLIGCVQGACFASFGPQDVCIVITTWGMELFQASSTTGNSTTIFKRLKSINGDIAFQSQPTCGLIVTSTDNVSSGNREGTIVLHDKFFGALSDGLSSGKPAQLLLK
ncbi:hypothetical protein KI387_008998, partial [Taxus chinensis]